VDNIVCNFAATKFYSLDENTGIYSEVACENLDKVKQYYAKDEIYVPVKDGLDKEEGVTYYYAEKEDLGINYLTSRDLIVEFSEPIKRVECSYYVFDAKTGKNTVKNCAFHNAEFDYNENKKVFELIFVPESGMEEYYVNYTITVYDFSDNSKTVNSLFIDREKPIISLNDNVSNVDNIEVIYNGDNDKSMYDSAYLTTGFMSQTYVVDSVNSRINSIGASSIVNTFEYTVRYFKFDYNLTYKNYTLDKGEFKLEDDGQDKTSDQNKNKTYYVLIKKPSDYILKGNSGVCLNIEGEEYCYVEDEDNYYPSLIDNNNYWIELDEDEYYIKNNKVGVYKVEYVVKDKSGNVSDILYKTIYFNDTKAPVKKIAFVDNPTDSDYVVDTNKYGYHKLVYIKYENEKEAMVYKYNCGIGSSNCTLPSSIFSSNISIGLESYIESVTETYSSKNDAESIYKIYFHDKGYYYPSITGDGEEVMVLKYNLDEYTFLIDKTKPDLYINAGKDDINKDDNDDNERGNLYYHAHLDKEETLYCGNDAEFSSMNKLMECSNTANFAGAWINPNDYVNMARVYEYISGTDVYKLEILNGNYRLYKNDRLYELEYVNDNEYSYVDNTNSYVVQIVEGSYKIKIDFNDFVELKEVFVYTNTKNSIKYKVSIDSDVYTLHINDNAYTLTRNANSVYVYEDDVNLMSYEVRYSNGNYQIKITDKSFIVREKYNSRGELTYRIEYQKLAPNAQKYFYNTYYYMDNFGNLESYVLGATYDENNVYIVKSIDLYFRNDGQYIVVAQDKSGNSAGRKIGDSSYETHGENTYSSFVIDNTAPSYNKNLNEPTGVNYWYSVPSKVILTNEEIGKIKDIKKGVKSYYNLLNNPALNDSFFYAFATRTEAENYLINIYSSHINSLPDNTCKGANGVRGFNYSYYNPSSNAMEMTTTCFVGKDDLSSKRVAINEITKIIKSFIYPVYSEYLLFGDSDIKQIACDSSVSGNCINNKDMYKVVYLKIDSTDPSNVTKNIVKSCDDVANDNIICEKVNVMIINHSTKNGNSVTLEVGGDNTLDTSVINVFEASSDFINSKPSKITSTSTISLNVGSYYVFEEIDTTIGYANYLNDGMSVHPTVLHNNSSYYAIYVDKNVEPISNGGDGDYLNVYYDEGNGIENDSLTLTGVGNVANNLNEYYLIIRNNGEDNFETKYEIHTLYYGSELLEVYSYLGLTINGVYHNINEYLVMDNNGYYFRIPMHEFGQNEVYKVVQFIDRVGNVTRLIVSISKNAPTINVVYSGSGGLQTVNVTISNTTYTHTKLDSIKVLYSATGESYISNTVTEEILSAFKCSAGSNGCLTSTDNLKTSYGSNISKAHGLYGFFKIELEDDHGNSNSVKFMYNPADTTAIYQADMKFIDTSMDANNLRMITNIGVELNFDNDLNYIILYKKNTSGVYEEVCNTKNIVDGMCPGEVSTNKVTRVVDEGGQVQYSILYYADEGYYYAKIINRASEVINASCGGEKISSCLDIQTDPYNLDPYAIINRDVVSVHSNREYNIIEVDKTAPSVDERDFVVNLPTGSEPFINNGVYTNAEVTVTWDGEFVQLAYICEYIDSAETCNGQPNGLGFMREEKEYTFDIKNSLDVRYTFWFEDFVGNTTYNNRYSFTIDVVLPDIELYQLNDKGEIIEGSQISVGKNVVRNNVKLLCYVEGVNDEVCDSYHVTLEKWNDSWTLIPYQSINDILTVSEKENSVTKYRFTVYVKKAVGYYNALRAEMEFTIDKQAPQIIITETPVEPYNIYKGEVTVIINDVGAKGFVYAGCALTGDVDELGNNIYVCNEDPYDVFENNIKLSETGIYMITAIDAIGNVTKGYEIKYVNIDNENPEISIKSKSQYSSSDISENGFTNAAEVVIEVNDNNESGYFRYRVYNNGTYGEWQVVNSNIGTITVAGKYEVQAIDAVGNVQMERHFIIDRELATYNVVKQINNQEDSAVRNDIIKGSFYVTWNDDVHSQTIDAPIVKVTVNGKPYVKNTRIDATGEYTFMFTDLAGNVKSEKVVVNNNDNICLNNVLITPKKSYILNDINKPVISIGDYKFSKDDVIILATPINYFGGSSACGADTLNYKTLTEKSYFVIGGAADVANSKKQLEMTLGDNVKSLITELGGSSYVFVVSEEVAKKDLDFPIGENFFTKDPLGWVLIFAAGVLVLYVGIRLVFFRKRVRVLK